MNLLPRTQGRGFGQQLFALWCDAALQRSVQAMHVGVNRANGGAARFWSRLGFQPLSLDGLPEGRTWWMGRADRKSVVEGKSGAVRVELGGRRIIRKKNQSKRHKRGHK